MNLHRIWPALPLPARQAFRDMPAPQQPFLPQWPAQRPRHGLALQGLADLRGAVRAPHPCVFRAPVRPPSDRQRHGAVPINDPPFSLNRLINIRGFSPEYRKYSQDVEKQLKHHRLDHYQDKQTDDRQVGRGSTKDCFRIDHRSVLLVQERSGLDIHHELINLKFLEKAGFPVVRIREAGIIPGRNTNGDGSIPQYAAMVQEKLGAFYSFERSRPKIHDEFLHSPLLNKNTLSSLRHIRSLIHRQGVAIGDLQGGIRPDGTFVLADITHLGKLSRGHGFHEIAMAHLDRLITDVSRRLGIR